MKNRAYPAILRIDIVHGDIVAYFPDLDLKICGKTVDETMKDATERLTFRLKAVNCPAPTSIEDVDALPGEIIVLVDPLYEV